MNQYQIITFLYIKLNKKSSRLLLLGHTDGAPATSGGLGVLAAHPETPVVTHASVGTDFLHAFQIFTQFGI
jgi:hypothetical protein